MFITINLEDTIHAQLQHVAIEADTTVANVLQHVIASATEALAAGVDTRIGNLMRVIGFGPMCLIESESDASEFNTLGSGSMVDIREQLVKTFEENINILMQDETESARIVRHILASLFTEVHTDGNYHELFGVMAVSGEDLNARLRMAFSTMSPAKAEKQVDPGLEEMISRLRASPGKNFKFNDLIIDTVADITASEFARMVRRGDFEGVVVSKDATQTNVYSYTGPKTSIEEVATDN